MDDFLELPDYFAETFEPTSVTVPRLRNILLENNVNTSSVTQKAQLVALYNEHVAPRIPRLRAARLRATRSSFGIVNAHDTGADSRVSDASRLGATPRRPARSRSARRTPGVTPEPPQVEIQPQSTARRARSRAKEDNSLAVKQSARPKSRRRTPVESKEEPYTEPEAWRNPTEGSPFSLDNPFQSGNTPAVKKRSLSGSSRRRSRVPSANLSSGQPSDFTTPVRRRKPSREDDMSDSDIEDIINSQLMSVEPEHQLDVPASVPSGRASAASIWAVVFAFSVILFTIWRQEKLLVGYCGIGDETRSVGNFELPEWIDAVRPTCVRCPQHAFCFENMETKCEPGFRLRQHPLSLGGLVPLVPSCESDGEQSLKVKAVTDRTVDQLRQVRAGFECKTPVGAEKTVPASPEIEQDELKSSVSKLKRRSMSEEEFEELWKKSLGELYRAPEVHVRNDGPLRFLSSSSLAHVSIACSVRRWFRQQVAKYFIRTALIVSVVVVGFYGRYRRHQLRELDEFAEVVAAQVFRQLAEQAFNNAAAPDRFPEKFLSMVHLRDDLLRDEFSAAKREKLWRPVQSKINQNSNVRASVREMQNGDVSRVWEWIGAIRPVEDGDFGVPVSSSSAKKRTSLSASRSRLSMLAQDMNPEVDNTPNSMSSSAPGADPSPLTSRWRDRGGVRKSLNADELVSMAKLRRDSSPNRGRDSGSSRRGPGPNSDGRSRYVV